jgi:hypothetical protein
MFSKKNYSEIPILIMNRAIGIPFLKVIQIENKLISFPIWIILL